MTIGPAPMIRIDFRSVRLGIFGLFSRAKAGSRELAARPSPTGLQVKSPV
jgi:hypothetical protein